MKKAIKRFWGIGLIVIILSSFFMAVPVAPASGAVYSWASDTTQPTTNNNLLSPVSSTAAPPVAGFGYTDIAQTSDGATIYMVADNTAPGVNYLYKSTNGGVSWSKPAGGTGSGTGYISNTSGTDLWTFVACAPDDPNIVVVIDGVSGAPVAYLSTNGGTSFSVLTGLATYVTTVEDLAISAPAGPYRYITVAGNDGAKGTIASWPYGSSAPTWSNIVAGSSFGTDVNALAMSPSFPSDNALLMVSTNATANTVTLHVYSYNTHLWDAKVDSTFPRSLTGSVTITGTDKARIALDPTFYMGDSAAQIGFIGASFNTEADGGVWRISTYSGSTLTEIFGSSTAGYAIGSVAWDGTNLAAAKYVPSQPSPSAALTIYRSADSLSSSLPTFVPSSSLKTPGTGFMAQVMWNGGNLLCISRGTNACVAKSTDLGKSFNGISLVNTSWQTINDFQVTADSTVIYLVADDGTDVNLWRYSGSAWQRVFITANATTQSWIVRMAASDPTAVFLGNKGASSMYISTDSGNTKWTARSCSTNFVDFTAETPSIVYAASTTANVVKSTNGAFTWGSPVNTNIGYYGGGTLNSISLVSAGNLIVTGTSGGVGYSTDSSATWTILVEPTAPLGGSIGPTLAVADGLGTGNTIYATDNISNAIYKWLIGTNTPITGWTTGKSLAAAGTGINMVNGVLYVQESSASSNLTTRDLSPTVSISASSCDNVTANNYAFSNNATNQSPIGYGVVNSLKASSTATSTTLWSSSLTKLYSWTEYLAVAANGPATTFPTTGYMVPVNSISGSTNNFVFQWSQPSNQGGLVSSAQAYGYTLNVYLDSAGKILYSTGSLASSLPSAVAPTQSFSAASLSVSTFTAGTTYYWKVKTTSPVTSPYTPMLSFTVQAIAGAVPAIISPVNGASILNPTPAFSWAPVTGTTQYDFQLSTTPTFGTTVLTDQPNTAGDLVPITIPLTTGKQYFWRVRALQPVTGDWSAVANFVVVAPATTAPPVTITNVPAPTITIPAPQPAPTYTLAPQAVEKIAPTYIWAIIIIGAILVIAVIVLIVRTRRSV